MTAGAPSTCPAGRCSRAKISPPSKSGYVTLERTEQDKRSVLVALTDTRRQRHRERQSALNQALHDALAEHDTGTLDAATGVLRHLASIYDDL
jgi:MarR family transcriptional regulator, organic hydroperoxide resistance regulator